MPRARNQRQRNLQDLKRSGDALEKALLHIFYVKTSYTDRQEYQTKFYGKVDEHTEQMHAACDYLRDELLKLQKLIIAMGLQIDSN